MELKLLLATSLFDIADDLLEKLSAMGIKTKITQALTVDDLVSELKKDGHHFIIAEYLICGIDILELARLVNSAQLSLHALPIYLLRDTLEDEIPPLLAKEFGIKSVLTQDLGAALKTDYEYCLAQGSSSYNRLHKKPTLLAIEDDEDAAELIRYNLKNDYQVDIATSGEEGLSMWERTRHDLVLLDYMLPGIQGDEVLDYLMEADKNQPVIIMTAYDMPDRNKKLILNGASEYLCKPFESEALKERCQTILNRAKLIYQMHYTAAKFDKLSNQLWLLDHHLSQNDTDKAKQVLKTIRLILPSSPPEDDHASLLNKAL